MNINEGLPHDRGGLVRERKPFDAAVRRLLDEQAAAGAPPQSMSNDERVRSARALMIGRLENRGSIPGLPNGVETRDVEIAAGLKARLYLPPGNKRPRPVLVYLHGGGWVVGSVATHDPFCRLLSKTADVLIASLEYRLAPEQPYPAALEDTMNAVQWATAHAAEWGGDPACIAIGGDSAGANLAAVTGNVLCAQEKPSWLRGLMLLYPVTDHPSANHPSYPENSGYGLEASAMHWFWEQYAPGASPDDPNAAPLRLQQMPVLPPTLVTTAEYDVLRDEGIAYADKLRAAGVEVTHLHAADMGHNFPATPNLVARFPQCNATLAQIGDWLKAAVAAESNAIS